MIGRISIDILYLGGKRNEFDDDLINTAAVATLIL